MSYLLHSALATYCAAKIRLEINFEQYLRLLEENPKEFSAQWNLMQSLASDNRQDEELMTSLAYYLMRQDVTVAENIEQLKEILNQ